MVVTWNFENRHMMGMRFSSDRRSSEDKWVWSFKTRFSWMGILLIPVRITQLNEKVQRSGGQITDSEDSNARFRQGYEQGSRCDSFSWESVFTEPWVGVQEEHVRRLPFVSSLASERCVQETESGDFEKRIFKWDNWISEMKWERGGNESLNDEKEREGHRRNDRFFILDAGRYASKTDTTDGKRGSDKAGLSAGRVCITACSSRLRGFFEISTGDLKTWYLRGGVR